MSLVRTLVVIGALILVVCCCFSTLSSICNFMLVVMDISDPIEAGPGVMLYTKEFYDHAATLLNHPHGVFVTQAGMAESIPMAVADVEGVDPSCYAPIYNTLRSCFECTVPYSFNIPSYGGDWGFVMAFHKNPDSESTLSVEDSWKAPQGGVIDGLIDKRIVGGPGALSFYDGITHLSMFALTKPLRKSLREDCRIITKEDPIFMF